MRALWLEEGAYVDHAPRVVVQMIVGGVFVGRRPVPRRRVVAWLWASLRAWWKWTTALPGDVFYDMLRDLYIRIEGGMGSRRQVRIVSGQAMHYRLVREAGLDALFDLTPTEPCVAGWRSVQPLH